MDAAKFSSARFFALLCFAGICSGCLLSGYSPAGDLPPTATRSSLIPAQATHVPEQVSPTPRVYTATPTPIPRRPVVQTKHIFRPGYRGALGSTTAEELHYLLFLPKEYEKDPQKHWPLVIFLHGMGERGDTLDDLDRLLKHGIPKLVEDYPDFPFIAVSPQCPTSTYWEAMSLVAYVKGMIETYRVDADRVYLTGLSMGGFGTWRTALEAPQYFAAIAPIAGGYSYNAFRAPDDICRIKDLPIWAFHGAEDDQVPPGNSTVLVDALQACGADLRYTLYPDAGHEESWTRAYANPALYAWLLSQRR